MQLKEQFCPKIGIIFVVFSEFLPIKHVKNITARWELQEGHLEKQYNETYTFLAS